MNPSRMLVSVFLVAIATIALCAARVKAQEPTSPPVWQSGQGRGNPLIATPRAEVVGPGGEVIGAVQPAWSPNVGPGVAAGANTDVVVSPGGHAGLGTTCDPVTVGGCCGPCGVYPTQPANVGGCCGPCDVYPADPGVVGGCCDSCQDNPAQEGGISTGFDFDERGLGVVRSFSVFGGVDGFRTPADLSHSGNFGFHEGLNFGAPVGDPWDYLGFQLGADDSQSNFTGDQGAGAPARTRNQVFLTGGVFHRAVGRGWQSGMTFDYLHDDYYPHADLTLIRSETSFVLDQWDELGYWGAYAIGGGPVDITARLTTFLEPNDLFHVFYRRHFTGGGQGRIWLGVSGRSDFLFGANCTVPLGTDWALENNFAYLLPRQGLGAAGQDREVWAVSIQLVWYPGRASRTIFEDPWQPVLNVADDSVFMVNRR